MSNKLILTAHSFAEMQGGPLFSFGANENVCLVSYYSQYLLDTISKNRLLTKGPLIP